ncbi:MAG: sulfatase-like hydrolase/transferase, partial [Fuerstiella sp.]
PAGVKTAKPQGDHKKIRAGNAWKEAIQAYLASVTYADAQLGRLLDAFETSGHQENTIVVLWGDHGWHLGEKHHWRKFALWEEATRAPLMWVVPGMTPKGKISPRTVDFMSIYPTLCELTGLEKPGHLDGISIAPLLKNPNADWDRPALTTHGIHQHAVRTERWRYIRYGDGSEELYDHDADPYEWTNLAGKTQHTELKQQLVAWMPKTEKPEVARSK